MTKRAEKMRARYRLIADYVDGRNTASVSEIEKFLKEKKQKTSHTTLARDLNTLLREKRIIAHGAGRATTYSINPLHKEIDISAYFDADYPHRTIHKNFNHTIFDLLQEKIFTENEGDVLKKLHEEFTANFSRYENEKDSTLIDKEFGRFLIDFSWKSSQIEGNTYSLLDTEALINSNEKNKDKTKEETQMILNHEAAFNAVLENKERFMHLSLGDIQHLHGLLMEDLHAQKNIRTKPVGITQTKYKPLGNEHQIREVMEKMVGLINGKDDFFEKAFLSLILLSYIQAFEDGNKRTARMVTNAILLAHGSMPISYCEVSRSEYIKASILFYEKNNCSYFKKIFIEQFEFAVKNYFAG